MIYSDLVTEYSPVIGAGNKVLDDLMKRLGVYTDIIDDNEKFIQDALHGNLAIAELMTKLNDYFELHHEKKQKGKRKTIKQ